MSESVKVRKTVVSGKEITMYSYDGRTWVSDIHDLDRRGQVLPWDVDTVGANKIYGAKGLTQEKA